MDGGLVDANHAPAWVLARLPGISPELAGRIINDMSITLRVAPQTLDEASTFLVFPGPAVVGE